MSFETVRTAILNTLKDLGNSGFAEFCSKLTDEEDAPRIRASEVQSKSRSEIVKLLVSRCTEAGALNRTIKTLRDIGCNNEALKLESRNKPRLKTKSSSVSEPDSAPEPLSDQANNVPQRFEMSAKDIIKSNKTSLVRILTGDHRLILNKVHEHSLITDREYNNLKGIYKENVEGHVVELVDTLMEKGKERCQRFLNLLETDDEIKETFPDLKSIPLSHTRRLTAPVQETCVMDNRDAEGPRCKKTKMDEPYPVNSNPRGICLIVNNINFKKGKPRRGTEKDAESLAKVFSWLGLRVLMCVDQTKTEMSQTLKCFSTLSDTSELQSLSLKEWSEGFVDLQEPPKHGDIFICCILSHGKKGVVSGTDRETLPIKDITRTFKASDDSPLTGKPKVFLIQACQGEEDIQHGVIEKDLETDEGSSVSVPEEADVLVAIATVEDYVAFRHTVNGSWFIQSLCQELQEGCSRGDDIHTILQRVNSEVAQKEGSDQPGQKKQMPEIRYTLRKKLILSPFDS